MRTRIIPICIVVALVAVAILFLATCSEKIVGNRQTTGTRVRISADMAAALKPSISVDSIFLTVSGSDMDTICS